MSEPSWTVVEELFEACLDLPSQKRPAFLRERSGGDADVIAAVERLLVADEAEDSFLEPPSAPELEACHGGDESAADVLSPGDRVGVFEIERRLASGGMGTVYVAHRVDREFDQVVAIKTLRGGRVTADARERFRAERQLLAQLDHPYIGRLYDGGTTDDDVPYLVMELVDGVAIDRYCRDRDLSLNDRFELFEKVASAVATAHRSLVIHRDLKPSNILVTADGVPKLLDFGIATVFDEAGPTTAEGPSASSRSMTPDYASPEQLRGEPVTTASDVYSLGIVLYLMLTGRHPLREAHDRGLKPEDPPPLASTVATDRRAARQLRGDFDLLLRTALAADVDNRYLSVDLMVEDLDRARRWLPLHAGAGSLTHRAGKLWARYRWPILTTLAILLTSLGWGYSAVRRSQVDRAQLAEIRRLSDLSLLSELQRDADSLPPALPENEAQLREWLERADDLVAREPVHRLTRDQLRDRATSTEEPWQFDTQYEAWQHAGLEEVLAGIESLTAPAGLLPRIRDRADLAATIHDETLGDYEPEWEDAIASIADEFECPAYAGLELEPQTGLIPLGLDPDSGLWEFSHRASGEVPEPGEDTWQIAEETGLVFVLIPGGVGQLGSIPPRPNQGPGTPLVDPQRNPNEHRVSYTFKPLLVAKFEMTQAQWFRATGSNPSAYHPGQDVAATPRSTLTHPVENVNWIEVSQVLRSLGLRLPNEPEWEYFARAGTVSPWYTGWTPESMAGHANIGDLHAKSAGGFLAGAVPAPFDDGFIIHAPVDTLLPNPWGLHHILGNVKEWTLLPLSPKQPNTRAMRGGGFSDTPTLARSACRRVGTVDYRASTIGVRPVMSVRESNPDSPEGD